MAHIIRNLFLALAFAVLVSGCTKQYNRLHFAAVDVNEEYPEVKFYRLTVTGTSWGSSTEMLTGLYDARSLQQLFGDIVKDDEVDIVTSDGATHKAKVFKLDPSKRIPDYVSPDERFTIFYGANAQSIAQQVSEFAKSEETGRLLGRLMVAATHGEKFEAALLAEKELAIVSAQVAELKRDVESKRDELKKLLPTPTATPTPAAPGPTPSPTPAQSPSPTPTATPIARAEVSKRLLEITQKTSIMLGSTEIYTDDPAGWQKAKTVHDVLVKAYK